MGVSSRSPEVVDVLVLNSNLIETSQSEGPDLILFKSMINSGIVGVRRVSVEGLSLDVIEFKGLIIIIHRDRVGHTNYVLVLGFVGLQTLEVVHLVKGDVIHVFKDTRVVHNILVEAREGVVKDWARSSSTNELLHAHMETSIELVVHVLVMLSTVSVISNASGSVGSSHTSFFTVSVDAPQVVNTSMDFIVVGVLGDQGRGDQHDEDVGVTEFENG